MQTNTTPLKDMMLKREGNYLSSGISTAWQIHIKERPRFEPALQPKAAAVLGNIVPATLARGHQQHRHHPPSADGGQVSPTQPPRHQDDSWLHA